MSAILRKHMKHKCDFCNYRSDLKYNMDRHVKRCSEYENNRIHQERQQSSNNIDNIMPSILGKQKKHKCEFCNYRSDLKYNFDRHVKRCSEYENVLMHQERPQSIYKIDNIIPSILGKQKKHKCEFCDFKSKRKYNVQIHEKRWHQEIIQSRNKIDKEKLRKSLILMKQEYIQKLKLGEKVFKILEEQNMEQVRLKEAYKEAVNLYIKQRLSIDD